MSAFAIFLVLVSAILHAGWNFFGQRSAPVAAFFLFAISCAAVITLPTIFIYRKAIAQLPLNIWILLLGTGIFQAVAYVGLSGAYRRGDLSITYPLARAVPIPLVAAASLLFGKAAAFTPGGLIGMLLVAFGCLVLPLRDLRQVRLADYLQPACLLALVAAVGIAGYTLIDGQAMFDLRQMPSLGLDNLGLALVYLEFETLTTCLVLGVYIIGRQVERQRMLRFIRHDPQGLRLSLVTGFVLNLSYILILMAIGFARDVSYVIAFRQLSIPLGAIMGITIEKEPAYAPKLLGIGIVSIGLLMVGLG